MPFSRAALLHLAALIAFVVLAILAGGPPDASAAQGGQGLQGGWAVHDNGDVVFLHSVYEQLAIVRDAGAGWVRINFRLGACYSDWTSRGCNGRTALEAYDQVVDRARNQGLRVLGLLSNESWRGCQGQWIANNAEVAGGSGDNPYVQAFARDAAGLLARHFGGAVEAWEIWNEPNAWTARDAQGNPTGGTYLYPSNFAWLLRHSYQEIKAARPAAIVVSGGVFGHDLGGLSTTVVIDGVPTRVHRRGDRIGPRAVPGEPAALASCGSSLSSGADYLCDTYRLGIARAGWSAGAYPLDRVGQHLYVDQGGTTSRDKLLTYVGDVRDAYAAYEGSGTPKTTDVTEFGWTTSAIPPDVQARNLRTAYDAFQSTGIVERAYWFSIQDVPEAALYYGLVDGDARPKSAFDAYRQSAAGPPAPPPTPSPSPSPSPTPSPTPTPAPSCLPRPRVDVVTRPSDGRLVVTVTATGANNRLRELRFGSASNALVDVAERTGLTGNTTVPLPSDAQQITFVVRRALPGQTTTVPLVVVDGCGEWPTFVGGGPGAF